MSEASSETRREEESFKDVDLWTIIVVARLDKAWLVLTSPVAMLWTDVLFNRRYLFLRLPYYVVKLVALEIETAEK